MNRTLANVLITLGALLSLLSGMCACAAVSGNGLTGRSSSLGEAIGGVGPTMALGLFLICIGWLGKQA